MVEPAVPGLPGENGNSKLDRVNQYDSSPPAVDPGEIHCGPEALGQNAAGRNSNDNEQVHALTLLQLAHHF